MNADSRPEFTDQLAGLLDWEQAGQVSLPDLLDQLLGELHPRVVRLLLGEEPEQIRSQLSIEGDQSASSRVARELHREIISVAEELDHPYAGCEHLMIVLSRHRDGSLGQLWDQLELRDGMVEAQVKRSLFPEV